MTDDELSGASRLPVDKAVGAGVSLALLVVIVVGVIPQFASYSRPGHA